MRRRTRSGVEYAVAETKACTRRGLIDDHLRRQFCAAALGGDSLAPPTLSPAWTADRLERALALGSLSRAHRDGALAALETGRLRRVVIVVICTDYASARRLHAPIQEGLRVPWARLKSRRTRS